MINILYIAPKEKDRWIYGDHIIRPIIRRILRGKTNIGGIEKVFLNLVESLHRSNIPFRVNPHANEREIKDINILLGRGIESLRVLKPDEPFIAGIGFSTHPLELPEIRKNYNIQAYLSHCEWINTLYAEHWGEICTTWPVGIDTHKWKKTSKQKTTDILIYNKIRWNIDTQEKEILHPILRRLKSENISYKYIRYGKYKEPEYQEALDTCRAMIFLCEHETQGIACNEALSSGLPVFSWDENIIRDPYYIQLKSNHIPCTSVPFFDDQCGDKFKNIDEFEFKFNTFYNKVISNSYSPDDYVKNKLSMEKSVERLLEIIDLYWKV
jgi:hypothetical protein